MNIPLAAQIEFVEALRGDYMAEMMHPKLSDEESADAARVAGKLLAVLQTLRNINEDMQGAERSIDAWHGFHRDLQDALGLPCSGTQETLAEIKRLKGLEEKEPKD